MALNFETKKVVKSNKDVLITVSNSNKNNGKEHDVVRIRFANETEKLIGDTDYLIIAVTDTRLYFASSNSTNGWKLSRREDTGAALNTKSPAVVGWAIHGGIGEYDLKYDQQEQLYFVEKEVLKFQQRLR